MSLLAQFQTAVSLVYPPRCLNCGGLVESDFGLCSGCWGDTHFISGLCCDHCGAPLPGEEAAHVPRSELRCDGCLRHPGPWGQGRAALIYAGQGRRMVLALKHGDRTDLAQPAAGWMQRAAAPLLERDALVVPVPLHWRRFLHRRYNQSALLAQALAARTGLACCPDALVRRRKTPMLEGRSREERHAILSDVIAPAPRHVRAFAGRRVLLVDDVLTSGATLAACTRACRAAGASGVDICVLARVTPL